MTAGGLKRFVLRPLEWFYPSAKLAYMWRMQRQFKSFKKGPILVLQMGKVGSKSVKSGLEALISDRAIYHAHFLSPERTTKTENQRRKFFRTNRYSYLRRPWLYQFLLKKFVGYKDGRTWKIVTLTREPVGRNISAFFENLDVVPMDNQREYKISSDYYDIAPTVVSVDAIDELADLFFKTAQHDSPVRFFDREIKDIFGIDVFNQSFSIENGYEIYKSGRVELLVLRLESLAECAGPAFREFLGIDNFKTINRNIAAKKVYAPLYEAFKNKVAIDSAYVDTLYDSKYMRQFYSAAETAAARAKWADSRHV